MLDFNQQDYLQSLRDRWKKNSEEIASCTEALHSSNYADVERLHVAYLNFFARTPLDFLLEPQQINELKNLLGLFQTKLTQIPFSKDAGVFLQSTLSSILEILQNHLALRETVGGILRKKTDETRPAASLTEDLMVEAVCHYFSHFLWKLFPIPPHSFSAPEMPPIFLFSAEGQYLICAMLRACLLSDRPFNGPAYYAPAPPFSTKEETYAYFQAEGLPVAANLKARALFAFARWDRLKDSKAQDTPLLEGADTEVKETEPPSSSFLKNMFKKKRKAPPKEPPFEPRIDLKSPAKIHALFYDLMEKGYFRLYPYFSFEDFAAIFKLRPNAFDQYFDAFLKTIRQTPAASLVQSIGPLVRKAVNTEGPLVTQILLLFLYYSHPQLFDTFLLHDSFIAYRSSFNPKILQRELEDIPIRSVHFLRSTLSQSPFHQKIYLPSALLPLTDCVFAYYDNPFAPCLQKMFDTLRILHNKQMDPLKKGFIQQISDNLINYRKQRTLFIKRGDHAAIHATHKTAAAETENLIKTYISRLLGGSSPQAALSTAPNAPKA